jgi:IS5 family transposase
MTPHIQPAELSFFSIAERLANLSRQGDPLERLNGVIDWSWFEPALNQAFPSVTPKGPGGRPSYPRLLLFRMLILQRLYSLSDEAIQFQVLDRLSFQRFLGLNMADAVPDQNTVREFREALHQADAFTALCESFRQQLEAQGLLPKDGVMVDATFVEVPRQRNTKEENEQIKGGQTPTTWSEKKAAHKDVDARWTKKNEDTFYGYKDHVKVNQVTKFIEAAVVTVASTHDSQVVADLVEAGDVVVFADSAYTGAQVSEILEERGVDGCIVQKGERNHPLNAEDLATNRDISRVRARVEHPFAVMSGTAGRIFQRYIGMVRNCGAILLMNLCYNLRRYETVVRLKLYPLMNA